MLVSAAQQSESAIHIHLSFFKISFPFSHSRALSGVPHGIQCTCMLSGVQLFVTPVDCSPPGSSVHTRQEYWSGLPFFPSADLPNAGTELTSPVSPALSGRFFTPEPRVLYNRLSLGIYFIYSSVCQRRQWHPTPAFLPGKSHGWRSLVGCSPWGHSESDTTERLHFHFSLSGIGEGNGNPLQCSCLENPRDRGAWWAAVYGVAQSRIRLKRLSSISSSI